MKELLEKVCSIDDVKGAWIFSKKNFLEKQSIPIDENIKGNLIKLFSEILNSIEDKIQAREIEFMFPSNFFIFKTLTNTSLTKSNAVNFEKCFVNGSTTKQSSPAFFKSSNFSSKVFSNFKLDSSCKTILGCG